METKVALPSVFPGHRQHALEERRAPLEARPLKAESRVPLTLLAQHRRQRIEGIKGVGMSLSQPPLCPAEGFPEPSFRGGEGPLLLLEGPEVDLGTNNISMQGPVARFPPGQGRQQTLPRGGKIAQERFRPPPIIQCSKRVGMGRPERSSEAFEKLSEATLCLYPGPL